MQQQPHNQLYVGMYGYEKWTGEYGVWLLIVRVGQSRESKNHVTYPTQPVWSSPHFLLDFGKNTCILIQNQCMARTQYSMYLSQWKVTLSFPNQRVDKNSRIWQRNQSENFSEGYNGCNKSTFVAREVHPNWTTLQSTHLRRKLGLPQLPLKASIGHGIPELVS